MPQAFKDRIGLQTIKYGEDFAKGLEATLVELRKLGFNGVEIFQAVSKLGDPVEFERPLKENSLGLLGLPYLSSQRWLQHVSAESVVRIVVFPDQFPPFNGAALV